MSVNSTKNHLNKSAKSEAKMPVLFVGHGSPMNAVKDNEFSQAWTEIGKSFSRPKAILSISAHWETAGTQVTAMELPKTIHDFYGFPKPLYQIKYSAPGSPEIARSIQQTIKTSPVQLNSDWGLDHGTWAVLCRMFPSANIPVSQLSLDRTKEPAFHYDLGKELKELRKKGILISSSGNMVHNLGVISWQDTAYDWALEFDEKLKQLILSEDHDSIIHYQKLGSVARLSSIHSHKRTFSSPSLYPCPSRKAREPHLLHRKIDPRFHLNALF